MTILDVVATIMAGEAGGGGQGAKGSPSPIGLWLPAILVIFMLFLWMQSRSQQKKQKKEREELLTSLKQKDKIETIGGIFGTIVNIREDTISIRVDDAKDITMKVAKSAIRRRLTDNKDSSQTSI